MFIFTAKINKKQILIVSAAIVLLAVLLLLAVTSDRSGTENAADALAAVRTNEDRISFLSSYGWNVSEEPIETQEIVIPRSFDGVYSEYLSLQKSQGFDLENYGGFDAVRYTYEVLNYPDNTKGVLADIIICRGSVIAADIQSPALNGFMHGLQQPDTKAA